MANTDETTWQEWGSVSNISESERTLSLAAGVLLAVSGLSRRSKLGFFVALFGAFFLHRGVTRQCAAYRWLGLNSSEMNDDIFETAPLAEA